MENEQTINAGTEEQPMHASSPTGQTSSVAWWVGLIGGAIPFLVALLAMAISLIFGIPFFLYSVPSLAIFVAVLLIALVSLGFRRLRTAGSVALFTLWLSVVGWAVIMAVYYMYFFCC
jgi:hypothetical protein